MTTATFDLGIDQQRSLQQPVIVELFINGEADGYNDGIRPASSDLVYLRGYAQGCRRKMTDIQCQVQMLEAEGLVVEATVEAMFGEKIPF